MVTLQNTLCSYNVFNTLDTEISPVALILELTNVRCLGSDTPDGRYRRLMPRSLRLLWLQCCVCDSLVTV